MAFVLVRIMYRGSYIQAQKLNVVHVYVEQWTTFIRPKFLVDFLKFHINLEGAVNYNNRFFLLLSFSRKARTIRSQTVGGTCIVQYGTDGMVSPHPLYIWYVCTVHYRAGHGISP